MGLHRFTAAQLLRVIGQIPGLIREGDQKHYLQLVRDVTCYNQAKIADYSFTINESHKKLKDIYSYVRSTNNSPTALDYQNLKEAYHETLSLQSFKVHAKENFLHMEKFYKTKRFGNKKARFCVKSEDNLSTEIVTLAGSVPAFRASPSHPDSESTGFSRVKSTGSYLLCNNIPEEIKKINYKNSRIIEADVLQFYRKPSRLENWKYRFTDKEDKEWMRCWRRNANEPNDFQSSAYYKSTLIVPLSIVADKLSDSFLKNFGVTEEKIVLGYLCLDHQNINFFNEDEDLDFAYIVADQLSLYLIHHWMCTTYSNVFVASGELLIQKGLLP